MPCGFSLMLKIMIAQIQLIEIKWFQSILMNLLPKLMFLLKTPVVIMLMFFIKMKPKMEFTVSGLMHQDKFGLFVLLEKMIKNWLKLLDNNLCYTLLELLELLFQKLLLLLTLFMKILLYGHGLNKMTGNIHVKMVNTNLQFLLIKLMLFKEILNTLGIIIIKLVLLLKLVMLVNKLKLKEILDLFN